MRHRLLLILIALFAATTVAVALAPKPGQGKEIHTPKPKPKSKPKPALPEIEMVYVEGGTFMMGSESDGCGNEMPVHSVTLFGFSIGKYEVTQKLWKAVMGTNPSKFKGDDLPVENVSWNNVQKFIRKLNTMTGKHYRLPTEAEWEFAARGGNRSHGYRYSGSDDVGTVAWCRENSGGKTHPVGTKTANELGIYDMTGNVWEWCQDWSDPDYYHMSPSTNPKGPATGYDRVIRGSGWFTNAGWGWCRVTFRNGDRPGYSTEFYGFRLAL